MNQLGFEYATPVAYQEISTLSPEIDPESWSRSDHTPALLERPVVKGKFLFLGDEKFWVKGVTYGTFRPDAAGHNFPDPSVVRSDMAAMARAGLYSIRVYKVPTPWVLDFAYFFWLRVMVRLPWEQHIAFLGKKSHEQRILSTLRQSVRECAYHPAVLCYAVGNEIPASVVRWYGRRRIAAFLRELADIVREEDPACLVTYVNFPTTEYLELDFIDFLSFNVYLESKEQ